jgi:hypothetical protein
VNTRKPSAANILFSILILATAVVLVAVLIWRTSPAPNGIAPPVADAEPERVAFEDALAAMAKAGEIVTVEAIQTPRADPADNAAITLRAAGAMADDDTSVAFDDLDLSPTFTDEQWDIIEENVFDLSPALKLVDGAEKQTACDWEVKWDDPICATLLLDINPTRSLVKVVSAAAMLAHHQGHDDEAVHRISQMLMIAKATDQKPFFVTHVVALNMAKDACQQVDWLGPSLEIGTHSGDAHPEQVQQLIKKLLDDDWVLQRFREACINSRLWVLDTTRLLGDGRLTPSQARELLVARNASIDALPTHAQIYADARLLLPYMGVAIAAADAKSWPEYQKRVQPIPPELADVYKHPLFVMMPQYRGRADARARDGYQAMARLRIAATTLALRAYAVDHNGELPPTLGALVPTYLPKVPLDPIAKTGGPLAYDPKADAPVTSAKPDEESATTKPTRDNASGLVD